MLLALHDVMHFGGELRAALAAHAGGQQHRLVAQLVARLEAMGRAAPAEGREAAPSASLWLPPAGAITTGAGGAQEACVVA